MTTVYGVTFVGASRQIKGQLKDKQLVPEKDIWQAGAYLARHTFASVGDLFAGARAIMDWLAHSAKLIAQAGSPVKWITPLGLPVVQPYRVTNAPKEYVKTMLQTICLKKSVEELPPNPNRQKSAFPPNFIHSLDSTHMLMTAVKMAEMKLTYASVHDSYWTHACYVDEMNKVLREKFIELHSEPLLQQLLQNFKDLDLKDKDGNPLQFKPLPPRGKLDLREVANSPYFFN